MKAQFFIISTVIMIYVIVMTTQNLYSFSDIKITKAEEILELNYVPFIKNSLIQTLKASFYSSELVCDKIDPDLDFTEKFLKEEMSTKGIKADFSHNILTCPITYFNYTLKTKELFSRTEFTCPKVYSTKNYNFSGIMYPSPLHKTGIMTMFYSSCTLYSTREIVGEEPNYAPLYEPDGGDSCPLSTCLGTGSSSPIVTARQWENFMFRIDKPISEIAKLEVSVRGWGYYENLTGMYNKSFLYLWNFKSNSWELKGSHEFNKPSYVTYTTSSNINYYINSTGYLVFAFTSGCAAPAPSGLNETYLYTDFANVVANPEPTYSWDC